MSKAERRAARRAVLRQRRHETWMTREQRDAVRAARQRTTVTGVFVTTNHRDIVVPYTFTAGRTNRDE